MGNFYKALLSPKSRKFDLRYLVSSPYCIGMNSFQNHVAKVCALVAATLILPALAFVGLLFLVVSMD